MSGGCCDGSSPMCLLASELRRGPDDALLGEIAGAPFYLDADQDRRWGTRSSSSTSCPAPPPACRSRVRRTCTSSLAHRPIRGRRCHDTRRPPPTSRARGARCLPAPRRRPVPRLAAHRRPGSRRARRPQHERRLGGLGTPPPAPSASSSPSSSSRTCVATRSTPSPHCSPPPGCSRRPPSPCSPAARTSQCPARRSASRWAAPAGLAGWGSPSRPSPAGHAWPPSSPHRGRSAFHRNGLRSEPDSRSPA
jgi:hypothetical protein